jgi:hypothetical protein
MVGVRALHYEFGFVEIEKLHAAPVERTIFNLGLRVQGCE